MKISAVSMPLYFNGQNNNYQKEIEEKSHKTLQLAIGTAVAGTGLLAVYYISRGKKPQMPTDERTIEHTINAPEIKKTLKQIKNITDKTSKEVLDKLPASMIDTINNIKINSNEFKARLISLLENGKAKVEYFGNEISKINKKRFYINSTGEIQGSITNLKNGKAIIERFKQKNNTEIHKKIFLDKNGKSYKTQTATIELQTSANIPIGFKKAVEISENNKPTLTRVTELAGDMKPLKTITNASTIFYGYSYKAPDMIVGHAFYNNGKYNLKFINNPKFQKEFETIESIYAWANGNFKKR